MWTLWWCSYSLGENIANMPHDSWCANTQDLCYFSTITAFVAMGSALGSTCLYLIKSKRQAKCKTGLKQTIQTLLPDIAFIYTDYCASQIPTTESIWFPWPNVLINFLGLFLIQALTIAILEHQLHLSTSLSTGLSAALYTTAVSITPKPSLQLLSIFISTALVPLLIAGTQRFFNAEEKSTKQNNNPQSNSPGTTPSQDQHC